MVWAFLLLLAGDIDLQAVDQACVIEARPELRLDGAGGYLAPGSNCLYHWDEHGVLIRRLDIEGALVSYQFTGRYYILGGTANQRDFSRYFDVDGKPLAVSPSLSASIFRFFNQVDGRLFVSPANILDYSHQVTHPYFSTIQEVRFNSLQTSPFLEEAGPPFVKINQRLLDLGYNFKTQYLALSHEHPAGQDTFLVVNQVENRVYFYNQTIIRRERIDGVRQPSEIPFITLQLSQYKETPRHFYRPGLLIHKTQTDKQRHREAFYRWWNQLGLIRRFCRFNDGYLIAYEIPDYHDGVCVGYHLGIAKLDRNFKTVGPLLHTDGMIMGVKEVSGRQQVVVFHTQPDEDGGMTPRLRFHDP